MILKIAVCDDNDKDIEQGKRDVPIRYRHLKAEMIS